MKNNWYVKITYSRGITKIDCFQTYLQALRFLKNVVRDKACEILNTEINQL